MARIDDDEDRPRRRPRDGDDRPARSRRRHDDDEFSVRPTKKSNTGLILGILGGVLFLFCAGGIGLAIYGFTQARKGINELAMQAEENVAVEDEMLATRQNFRQIGLAMHNHHDAMNYLPHDTYTAAGKKSQPLLSWRVHLLPYCNQDALYRKFKLNEAWNSPSNSQLLTQMPDIYKGGPQARVKAGSSKTFYRGFTHRGAAFEKPGAIGAPPVRVNWASVQDGLINTILIVDAGEAVEWTKPDDFDWSPGKPRPALGGAYPKSMSVVVLMGDGMPKRMLRTVTDQTFRNLIHRQDGMIINERWED